MHHHHDAEEQEFFPSIERISGVQGLMEGNVEQHRAFTPGFDLFQEYARSCPPKDYDGQKIKNLIEGFADPLTRHLREEIDTLRALDVYDSARIRQAYQRFEKSLMATDNVRIHFDVQRKVAKTTDPSIVSYRTLSVRHRRPELRRRHA